MKRFPSVLTYGAALAFALGMSGVSAADPSADEIQITNLVFNGSGCPPGHGELTVSPDGQSFRLRFDDAFVAELGPGIPLIESRKNCQIAVTFHVPQGFTYAVGAIDYRGHADIADGSFGLQKAIYYFQGQPQQVSTTRQLDGPFEGNWHFRDEFDATALVWAPCGVDRTLNINAQVRLARGTASPQDHSIMEMDTERGRVEQIFHFHWKACP